MKEEFVKYRSLNDKALAVDMYNKLVENNIPATWEDTEGYFDVTFANNDILNLYYIRIKPQDFKKADELLFDFVKKDPATISDDYYLYSFTDEELRDVLSHPDEWNEFDQYWAKQLLEKRGVPIKPEDIQKDKDQRLSELREPWKLDKIWLLLALFLLVIAYRYIHPFCAFGGIFLGIYISLSKKTLPNGERVPAFSDLDRVYGKLVLAGAILASILIVLFWFEVLDIGWWVG